MNVLDNPVTSWSAYFAASAKEPLHPLYTLLDPLLPASGEALELGCGVGIGARHLASQGFNVVAVDALAEPLDVLRALPSDGIEIRQAFIEELELEPARFDVVVAGFCLFFIRPDQFDETWDKIVSWVKPGGLIMGQFLGTNDSWATKGYSTQSQDRLREMLRDFEPLHWDHQERDGTTIVGVDKHWDVTHLIARKANP